MDSSNRKALIFKLDKSKIFFYILNCFNPLHFHLLWGGERISLSERTTTFFLLSNIIWISVNHFSDCFGYRQSKPHLSLLCIFLSQLHNFGKKKRKKPQQLCTFLQFLNWKWDAYSYEILVNLTLFPQLPPVNLKLLCFVMSYYY